MNCLGVNGIFGSNCRGVQEAYGITLTLLAVTLTLLLGIRISKELHLHF